MEAPEKIYFDENDVRGVLDTYSVKFPSDVFEYIRTDIFIEKAEDFIRRKICDYIVHYNYGTNNDIETMYLEGRFFDDFENYIKGE